MTAHEKKLLALAQRVTHYQAVYRLQADLATRARLTATREAMQAAAEAARAEATQAQAAYSALLAAPLASVEACDGLELTLDSVGWTP